MTRGNQRELARQKNMKKQSDSVKGKRRDDGLSAAARKQSAITSSWDFLYSVYFPPYPLPTQRIHTNLLCSCARGLVGDSRWTSSTACSRWKVAVPAHTRCGAATGSPRGAGRGLCGGAVGSIWRLRGTWSWSWRLRPAVRSGLLRSQGSMTVVRRTWSESPTMRRRRRSRVRIWRRPCP
uniref:Huntingtin interacting protein K n=1 Tax=Equus caballus TaxID=9796 RepID=F6RXG4_HORSE